MYNTNDLGMFGQETRIAGNLGFEDCGYDIIVNTWQTLIVTGVGDTTTGVGTSNFYVNGVQVGFLSTFRDTFDATQGTSTVKRCRRIGSAARRHHE